MEVCPATDLPCTRPFSPYDAFFWPPLRWNKSSRLFLELLMLLSSRFPRALFLSVLLENIIGNRRRVLYLLPTLRGLPMLPAQGRKKGRKKLNLSAFHSNYKHAPPPPPLPPLHSPVITSPPPQCSSSIIPFQHVVFVAARRRCALSETESVRRRSVSHLSLTKTVE